MKISPIIFGSTGMIGQGVLLECLDSDLVEKVLIINRKNLKIHHPKLREILRSDISDLSGLETELRDYDTCFWCLGVSAVGMSEKDYHEVTHDLTRNVAEKLLRIKPDYTFCYISGKGTDSSEKGSAMWARVKGKTENALLAMPFKKVYMFRPGFIKPLRGIKSRTALYNAVYTVMRPFYFILKYFKNSVTTTSVLGRAMINTAAKGYEKKILESRDINEVGK